MSQEQTFAQHSSELCLPLLHLPSPAQAQLCQWAAVCRGQPPLVLPTTPNPRLSPTDTAEFLKRTNPGESHKTSPTKQPPSHPMPATLVPVERGHFLGKALSSGSQTPAADPFPPLSPLSMAQFPSYELNQPPHLGGLILRDLASTSLAALVLLTP